MSEKKGFTLIELLVVVAIISLLSSVVMASLNTAKEKGRNARRLQDIQQLQNAIALYQANNNGAWPPVPPNASYCIGEPTDGTPCWNGIGAVSALPRGNTVLNNALATYIKAPLDPSPNRTWGEKYLYVDASSQNISNGCNGATDTGHFIFWEPDNLPLYYPNNNPGYTASCLNKGYVSCCGVNGQMCGGIGVRYCAHKLD